jgi:hypothetical protein
MRTRAKVGNKPGNPAYRTPSRFIAHKTFKLGFRRRTANVSVGGRWGRDKTLKK